METIAGIDGGGSKTLVALCSLEGHLLGLGRGGPSNVDDVGVGEARRNISVALQAACSEAGVGLESIRSGFFGMAWLHHLALGCAPYTAPLLKSFLNVSNDIK